MKNIFFSLGLLALMGLSGSAKAQTWPPVGMLGAGTSSNPFQITDSLHLRVLITNYNLVIRTQ